MHVLHLPLFLINSFFMILFQELRLLLGLLIYFELWMLMFSRLRLDSSLLRLLYPSIQEVGRCDFGFSDVASQGSIL